MAVSTPTSEYIQAVEHLPEGAMLVFTGWTWEQYEELLEALERDPRGVRVSYDDGRLEIVSPSRRHERISRLILLLVHQFCGDRELALEPYGAATWRRKAVRKGAEPDECFYVGATASAIIGKPDIDLDVDPPPDLAVEVDIAHGSIGKLGIYAALGVSEVWRYADDAVRFYRLERGQYIAITVSGLLPGLTPEMVLEMVTQGLRAGQAAALAAFRKRLRTRPRRKPGRT
jgi:Uma2 family endonuclease